MRQEFLRKEGIEVFAGEAARQVAAMPLFQEVFKRVAPSKGRGDAALAAFAAATRLEAVTFYGKLVRWMTKTANPPINAPMRVLK